jgi:hypothetical protein
MTDSPTQKATYQAAYYVANKSKIKTQQAAYYAANKDRILAQQSEYYAANKERIRREAAYRAGPAFKTRRGAYYDRPEVRSRKFVRDNPDCTSTAEEIEAAYSTGSHVGTGKPGKIGIGAWDLMLGHVHGGPIVGLIYGWENRALTQTVLANWGALEETMRLHRC